MVEQAEQLRNSFELKMEEGLADARFLAWHEIDQPNKELNKKEWKEFLETIKDPKEKEKHENLKIFLDATENNLARQGKSRRECADAYWKQSKYGEKYDWRMPKYEK